MTDSDVAAAARRLIEDHKLYFEDSHDQRCQDTILVATWALGAGEREERMRAALEALEWQPQRTVSGDLANFCPVCHGCVGAYALNERVQPGRHRWRPDGHRQYCLLAPILDDMRATVAPADVAEGEA